MKKSISERSSSHGLEPLSTEYSLVVIGTAGSGKSCCTIRYVSDRFVEEYDPTLEDLFKQTVNIDGDSYVLKIYDTAGVEEFPIVKDGYMREADGFLCVYAINALESFEEVTKLYEWVMRVKENKSVPFVLVGNKCDLEDKRAISVEKGEQMAKSMGLLFFETSAKTGLNIEKAYTELVRQITTFRIQHPDPQPQAEQNEKTACPCTVI